jgi:Uma2 family endonuclease
MDEITFAVKSRTARGKLGPSDHGRRMTVKEFEARDFAPGHKYELIDGRLYVTYELDPPQDLVEKWLYNKVWLYSAAHPEVINYATDKARVFVPNKPGVTIPEPDLAAYANFPLHLPYRKIRWRDVSPLLAGEVISPDDPHKDLVRNVKLYWHVPSIMEYWLLDTRVDPEQPTLRVYRRVGRKWRIIELGFGDRYTTKLLPGFELLIDPRK